MVLGTYCVIDTPHKNRQYRFIGSEQLNLLMFNTKMFLFKFTQSSLYLSNTHFNVWMTAVKLRLYCREYYTRKSILRTFTWSLNVTKLYIYHKKRNEEVYKLFCTI